jgi:hypothetical protein
LRFEANSAHFGSDIQPLTADLIPPTTEGSSSNRQPLSSILQHV